MNSDYCYNCNTPLLYPYMPCPECGNLNTNSPLVAVQKTQNTDNITPNTDKSYKLCPYCNEQIRAEAQKCKHCGEFLNNKPLTSNRINSINNSGQGDYITIPSSIKRWSWGAFFLNWIWGIGNKSYLTLLTFIPVFGIVWVFVCGAKGNEWAWKNKQWRSIEHFHETQKTWAAWGLGIFIFSILCSSFWFITFLIGMASIMNNNPY